MKNKQEALKRLTSLEAEAKELRIIINRSDSRDITERVKTFEDACDVLGICEEKLPDVSALPREHRKMVISHYKLTVIAEALNEGWNPNWNDHEEKKHYPFFAMKSNKGCGGSGFGFSDTHYDFWGTLSACSSWLCFRTQQLAEYAGRQFEGIYKDFLVMEDKELRKINSFLN